MNLRIAGAGLGGLFAAQYFRHYNPIVIERQSSLPNNHNAVLRFRTTNPFLLANIPHESITVRKSICYDDRLYNESSIKLNNLYSMKVTGKVLDRSIGNLKDSTRYIPSVSNMIDYLTTGVDLRLDTEIDVETLLDPSTIVISTIPMPVLMKLVGWQDIPEFEYSPIDVIYFDLPEGLVKINQTVYYPSPDIPQYRVSVVNNRVIIECIDTEYNSDGLEGTDAELISTDVMKDLGLYFSDFIPYIKNLNIKRQKYGKITEIDEGLRKEFIYTMTKELSVYLLGRFATWRNILLDDVIKDLKVIESLIFTEERRRNYHQDLSMIGRHK